MRNVGENIFKTIFDCEGNLKIRGRKKKIMSLGLPKYIEFWNSVSPDDG